MGYFIFIIFGYFISKKDNVNIFDFFYYINYWVLIVRNVFIKYLEWECDLVVEFLFSLYEFMGNNEKYWIRLLNLVFNRGYLRFLKVKCFLSLRIEN